MPRPISTRNAEIGGFKKRGGGHQNGGHANQRVKSSHKLRHIRHRYAPRRDPANAATNGQCSKDFGQAGDFVRRQSGSHRNRHAGHAKTIAASGCGGGRQATQGQNEENARGQISK
jgi:hypothetical protein